MKRFLPLVLFFAAAASAGPAPAQRSYPLMRPDQATKRRWIESYKNAPRAYIDPALKPRRDSVSLLPLLQYTPSERDQGYCGNCWAWAGTGCMEILLNVQASIKDRLSVQYINSCETGIIGKACCDGGWLEDLANFYASTKKAVPWSNTGASWQDGDASCDTSCASVGTSPYYGISTVVAEAIVTQGVGQDTAIDNIKNVLDQNKPVWFAFFMGNETDWQTFINFWNTQNEGVAFNFDYSCGKPYEPTGAGHAVLCVGYNDDDPSDAYWIMLNSWGTTAGRPNGLFRVDMNMNYDCADLTPDYNMYFQALNITYTGPPTPTPAPATMGSILVNTTPVPGAGIYLDYFETGLLTNTVLSQVSPGSHAVWVSHLSYPPQAPVEGVEVTAGKQTVVSIALRTLAETGDILVLSEPEKGAAIYLDYRNTGLVTDATLFDVGPGTHFVSIRKDDTVAPGVQPALVETGLTTPLLFELWASTETCPITVSSTPAGAEIFLDYLTTEQVTEDTLQNIGYGIHDVTVSKAGYLLPPPLVVELSASTCATSIHFDLVVIPSPTPTPTITPTPAPTFPPGLRVWVNKNEVVPGDVLDVSVSFTDTILDWDGYVVVVRSDGRAWSILPGNRIVEGVIPAVRDALEIHYPWGPVRVFVYRIPSGISGYYSIYAAILPTGTPPTLENAYGKYSQVAIKPVRVTQ